MGSGVVGTTITESVGAAVTAAGVVTAAGFDGVEAVVAGGVEAVVAGAVVTATGAGGGMGPLQSVNGVSETRVNFVGSLGSVQLTC